MDRNLRSYKIEGFVIKRQNFGEADKLVTVLTKNKGKVVLIAKGVRRINSRRAPHLELFNKISAFVAAGRNFDIVTEAQTAEVYKNIKEDLDKIAFAYRMAEVVDRLCPERENHYPVFLLCENTFAKLDGAENGTLKSIVEEFILELVKELGYLPRENVIVGEQLDRFLEEVMEKNLKSDSLLSRL